MYSCGLLYFYQADESSVEELIGERIKFEDPNVIFAKIKAVF